MYLPLVALMAYGVIGALAAWRYVSGRQRRATVGRSPWLGTAVVAVIVLLGLRVAARCREYESPLTLARTVLDRWPTPNADYLMGTELAAVGRHEEAIPYLSKAVQGYPPTRYYLGTELLAVGRIDEGVTELQRFVEIEPGLVATRSARIRMGRAFEARQQWDRAIEQFRLILMKDPSDTEAHGLLADALAGAQLFEQAIPHYRAYLDRRSDDANAWTGLGIALAATSQSAGAVEAFRKASDREPANLRFRLNLARALLDVGDISQAGSLAQQVASADGKDPAAEEILARVYLSRGEIDLARRHFERALAIDRSYAPAQEGLRSLRIR
jgi:tetratricopeptide (TPR) repeat protein